MPKGKGKKKEGAGAGAGSGSGAGVAQSRKARVMGADDMVAAADAHMEDYELESAAALYDRALKKNPNDTRALEGLASVMLEIGNVDVSRALLIKAVGLEPAGGYSKFMSLAQLVEGKDALDLYQKGVAILEKMPSTPITSAELVSSLCAMAELFMTDLCYEEGAEAACEGYLERAMALSPNSYEVHQSMANLRASQQRPGDALTHIRRTAELIASLDDEHKPSLPFRLSTTRIMLELNQTDDALQLLKVLIAEDDELVETWYTLAVALMQHGRFDLALAAVNRASVLHAQELKEASGGTDAEMMEEEEEEGEGEDDGDADADADAGTFDALRAQIDAAASAKGGEGAAAAAASTHEDVIDYITPELAEDSDAEEAGEWEDMED